MAWIRSGCADSPTVEMGSIGKARRRVKHQRATDGAKRGGPAGLREVSGGTRSVGPAAFP